MNRAPLKWLGAAAMAIFALPALADSGVEARQWLERMATAMNQMSYQGTFVYMRGAGMETMRITHIVDEQGIRERLYSIDGPQREVIRDRDGVRCVLGDGQAVMEDPVVTGAIFPDIPIAGLDEPTSPYGVKTGPLARLAGHHGRRITITPRDEFRYGYDLWLEEKSGLLLKWVLFDAHDNMLARLVFTELRLGNDIVRDELHSTTPLEQFTRLESHMPQRQVMTRADPRWVPSELPPGFTLAAHSHQEEAGENVFEHLVYSDGLASVSVYIEQADPDFGVAEGLSRLGTANAFYRRLGARHLTVIGEVPPATVRAIGNAFPAAAPNP
ncbi:MAG: hypothetical protein GTN86_04250 [Xanthomonadales bacterium]|uniref:MucB/RseB C-terminal domain-containing protein n=1 Tax=Hydrogenophaga sp. TaxID=1904254 RepID=UPI0016AB163C|nr:MucB/RseB C-terminal domain-containing protein [Hydrogenophaga sp.]NIM69834.1 hypothetical protein [Xanthomonadales bacterium]NIN32856.1 hypothetical protein [Hydrogenophaga sp.]NIN59190.1 hypothetical protein [Xanthomonadales bacterium]NIN74252.1 hypothetical protein [Xanthomonadales bacterium]NIO12489.1 hypothetical protein [Xanthomonadales bacterium]